MTPPHAREQSDWQLIRRIWPFVARSRGWLWLVLLMIPLGVATDLLLPLLLKTGIDDGIMKGDAPHLATTALQYMVVVFVAFITKTLGMYGLQLAGLRALAGLRTELFTHVTGQGQRFFDRRTTGSLMTRTTNDVEAIYESLAWGAVSLISDAMVIVSTLCVMLYMDWRLSLALLALAPILAVLVNVFRKRLRVLFLEIRKSLSRLNGFFAEQIHGMQVIQHDGAEDRARSEFRAQAYDYLDRYRQANWLDAGLYAIMDGMSSVAVGLIIAVGAWLIDFDSAITLGLLIAFIEYTPKVFVPIREFSSRFATIQRAVAALERVFGLLDTDERINTGPLPFRSAQPALRFQDVSFAYSEDRADVLKGIDLDVAPGEVLAIVGATGSGKSTIGKLLLRMYDGYKGAIFLGDHELREYQTEQVRANVAVVHQDPYLFEGTITENISLWSDSVSENDARVAGSLARVDSITDHLPAGYDHHVTERGANLSAGQRQLISIARALARPAPVVILDEATASVDSITEQLIDEAIEALFESRTVIVIAHRISTIAKADRILVLHQGAVVEYGSHDDLLELNGHYALLARTGFSV